MDATRDLQVCAYPLPREEFDALRKGPWPQPASDNPMGMAAEVMHPTPAENRRWRRTVLINYLRALLTKLPLAFYNWFINGWIDHVSDEECVRMLTQSSYSKFLRRRTAEGLEGTDFRRALGPFDPTLQYLITDFTTMKVIRPYDGMYVAPTVALLSRKDDQGPCTMVAISIGHREGDGWKYTVLTPKHGHAWTLAKYFVIQGAGHMISLCGHPATHFPYDTVNAVTVSAIPMRHTIFKLLQPHLDLHLSVDNAVLEGGYSIVSETRGEFYAPFVGPSSEVRKLVAFGFHGYPDQGWGENYSPWTYPCGPGEIPSDYGRFLAAYYGAIRKYVREVVAYIHRIAETSEGKEECYYIRRWAHHIAQWLPGFPEANEILEPMLGVPPDPSEPYPRLVTALTTYIWDVAIAHPLEHSVFGALGPHRTSFRVRVPPPESEHVPAYSRRQILSGWDMFKSTLAFEIFFKPHNISNLVDVKYGFEEPELQAAAGRFQEDLRQAERHLTDAGIDVRKYVVLKHFATSIQY